MAKLKPLAEQRRCHNHEGGLHSGYNSFLRKEKLCPNYVNMKRPRKHYWQRWIRAAGDYAEKMCWAYICDWCYEDLPEDEESWPTGDNGQFIGSMECSLP